MLLTIDVGNSNIVFGLYDGQRLMHDWRLSTDTARTSDEYAVLLHGLFVRYGVPTTKVDGVIIASVVPPVTRVMEALSVDFFGRAAHVVGPDTRSGIAVLVDNPAEVGADRIVNAVAGYEKYRCAQIIIDFGTATTFDYVSSRGEYYGGAIAPGLAISADALCQRASKLPKVDIARPARVIARNTVGAMQAGIFYGYVGLVDGIVDRMMAECGEKCRVIATGGLAGVVAPESRTIVEVDGQLTLDGLRILHERNR